MAGSFPLGQGVRRWQARRSVPAARPWPGRDAAGLPGIRSPGTVTTARSAASSIRSRRSISSPMCRTSDASSAALRGWIRAQNAARLRMSVRRLLMAARVATWGIPRHLSASRRPSGQAGPAGSPASFTGTRRSVVIIGIGSSFAVCGRCGHCVRCRTRRAAGRLTARHSQRPGGNVRDCGCQGTVTVLMVMRVSGRSCPAFLRDWRAGAGVLSGRWQRRPSPARGPWRRQALDAVVGYWSLHEALDTPPSGT